MKLDRSRFAGLAAGFALLSLLAVPVAAQAAPAAAPANGNANKPVEPSEVKEFGDWTVRCYPVSSPSPCEMIEMLVNKKTGRRVLGIMLVYIPSRDQHVIQVSLPLGVALQNGAVIGSDTFTSGVLRFSRCDLQGCYAEAGIDKSAIDALAKATNAEMRVVSADGKKFNLKFSLKGFSSAHDALVQLARSKATNPPAAAAAPSGGN